MAQNPRIREISKLVPGQSRLRGRSRRHPSLATDAQAWARAVWTPCLPQPRPAMSQNAAKRRLPLSSPDRLAHVGLSCDRLDAALALDDLDRDHAAQGPNRGQGGGEQG